MKPKKTTKKKIGSSDANRYILAEREVWSKTDAKTQEKILIAKKNRNENDRHLTEFAKKVVELAEDEGFRPNIDLPPTPAAKLDDEEIRINV